MDKSSVVPLAVRAPEVRTLAAVRRQAPPAARRRDHVASLASATPSHRLQCGAMTDGACPYLQMERTARRPHGLTLEPAGPVVVSEVWYCRHPFHGVAVPLSDGRREARHACAACTLPGGGPGDHRAEPHGSVAAGTTPRGTTGVV